MLELLAAVCFVSGGHEIILRAFDNFKAVTGESRRFETLLNYYQYEDFHIGRRYTEICLRNCFLCIRLHR